MPIRGLFVYGTTLLSTEDGAEVSKEPVYLPADQIERGIADGSLHQGILHYVQVQPPVDQWPESWRFLKE